MEGLPLLVLLHSTEIPPQTSLCSQSHSTRSGPRPPSPPPMETDIQATPPAIPAVAGEAKRPRKRSRYLSPPYTDADDAPAVQVCAADVMSALRAAALQSLDSQQRENANAAQALRFLSLYRNSRSAANPLLEDEDAPAAAGHKPLLDLSAKAKKKKKQKPTPAPGSTKAKKKQKQNPQHSPPASATSRKGDETEQSKSDFAVNTTNAKRKKKKKNSTGQEQVQHFGNPVALVLDFAEGTPLPSTDDLLSTFSKFGFLIHSETAILKDNRSARLVFATRAEAEAAYSCAQTLGPLPFATPRLQDLPPITLNAPPPPVPKLSLKDVRNNLEKMILSLTRRSSSSFKAAAPQGAKPAMGNLVGEMQGLLTKVDKMLQGASSTVHHH